MFNYDTGQTLILALFHFASSDFDTKITWKDWLNLNDSLSGHEHKSDLFIYMYTFWKNGSSRVLEKYQEIRVSFNHLHLSHECYLLLIRHHEPIFYDMNKENQGDFCNI